MRDFDVHITPEPPSDERDAVLAAVRALLEREVDLARPPLWRVAGWTGTGAGLADLGGLDARTRWRLSSVLPLGGRVYSGLYGRGDAK